MLEPVEELLNRTPTLVPIKTTDSPLSHKFNQDSYATLMEVLNNLNAISRMMLEIVQGMNVRLMELEAQIDSHAPEVSEMPVQDPEG